MKAYSPPHTHEPTEKESRVMVTRDGRQGRGRKWMKVLRQK